jgi:hypothetical protein
LFRTFLNLPFAGLLLGKSTPGIFFTGGLALHSAFRKKISCLNSHFSHRQIRTTMESLLSQSRAMCPFLKKTSPATLRSLSTATHQSPGGGTITNLQFIARRCPVMNKALAVQSARIRTATYTKAATGAGTAKSLLEKKLHTSAEKKASVDINNVFNNRPQGEYHHMCIPH